MQNRKKIHKKSIFGIIWSKNVGILEFQVKEKYLFEETLVLFHFKIILYISVQGHTDICFEQISVGYLPKA